MKTVPAILALIASFVVNAQFGGLGMDMMSGPMATLQRPEIRKELKLTKEQNKQMDEVMKNFTKASQGGEVNLGSFSKIDAQLLAVLDEPQKQRYFELSIQIRGGTAITDPVVATKLDLSDEQKASAKKIRKSAQDKLMDSARKGSRDVNLMEKLSKAEEMELLAVLSDDQKSAFVKLAGVTFKGARIKGMWPI